MNEASSGGDGLHFNRKVGIVMAVDNQANGLAGSQSGQAMSTILSGVDMKTMNCKQLGGACDKVFRAETFDEMAEQAKQHGAEMFHQKDAAHLQAMSAMQELMQKPEAMQEWFESKKDEFAALPDD